MFRNLLRPYWQVRRQTKHSAAVLKRRDERVKLIPCITDPDAVLYQDPVHAVIPDVTEQDVQVDMAGVDFDPDPDI